MVQFNDSLINSEHTMSLIVQQKIIATDQEGFLLHLLDWNEDVANAIADEDNLYLTAEHWQIIYFLRDFYQQFQTTPQIRILVKALAQKFGQEKGNSVYLHQLFPGGPAKQASKIAGLPKPVRCI